MINYEVGGGRQTRKGGWGEGGGKWQRGERGGRKGGGGGGGVWAQALTPPSFSQHEAGHFSSPAMCRQPRARQFDRGKPPPSTSCPTRFWTLVEGGGVRAQALTPPSFSQHEAAGWGL